MQFEDDGFYGTSVRLFDVVAEAVGRVLDQQPARGSSTARARRVGWAPRSGTSSSRHRCRGPTSMARSVFTSSTSVTKAPIWSRVATVLSTGPALDHPLDRQQRRAPPRIRHRDLRWWRWPVRRHRRSRRRAHRRAMHVGTGRCRGALGAVISSDNGRSWIPNWTMGLSRVQ
jgi:hypothetical protein